MAEPHNDNPHEPLQPPTADALSTIRHLSERIHVQPYLYGLALTVLLASVVVTLAVGIEPTWRVLIILMVIVALIAFFVIGLRAHGQEPLPAAPPLSPPPAHELVIDRDGHFVGSDAVVADLVISLLDLPTERRVVTVHAASLADPSWRRARPDQAIDVKRRVSAYELMLNCLFKGTVYYALQWDPRDLVQAVLELRSIALPAQVDRTWWFTWSPDEPNLHISVGFTPADVKSISSGYYRFTNTPGGQEGIPGIPEDEPIWLQSIYPSIVWQRVVPAVLAERVGRRPGSGTVPPVDISLWVLSNKPPSSLKRARPVQEALGSRPEKWSW